MKKLLVFFGVLGILAAGGYYGYLFFEKNKVSDELTSLENELKVLNEESLNYKNEQVSQAVKSKQTAESLALDLVLWSEIVEEIDDVIPTDSGDKLVSVLSYSGSSNQNITINFKTNPRTSNAYFDVSEVIKEFNESDKFDLNFVPSITRGVDDEGQEVLSFLMNSEYLPEGKFVQEEPEINADVSEEANDENDLNSDSSEDFENLNSDQEGNNSESETSEDLLSR